MPQSVIYNNLPSDCFRLVTVFKGGVLIFSSFHIFYYSTRLNYPGYCLSLTTSFLNLNYVWAGVMKMNVMEVLSGISNAIVQPLDPTKIAICKEKDFFMLYIYYDAEINVNNLNLVQVRQLRNQQSFNISLP